MIAPSTIAGVLTGAGAGSVLLAADVLPDQWWRESTTFLAAALIVCCYVIGKGATWIIQRVNKENDGYRQMSIDQQRIISECASAMVELRGTMSQINAHIKDDIESRAGCLNSRLLLRTLREKKVVSDREIADVATKTLEEIG